MISCSLSCFWFSICTQLQSKFDLQSDLRKLVSCLEQHNGIQLTDAVPCLVEVLNVNCAVLKSVNINSLIQIGYYVLEGASVHHKETNEYISRLVAALLNSAVDENKETKVMQEKFLLAVWCRTGEAIPYCINQSASFILKKYTSLCEAHPASY